MFDTIYTPPDPSWSNPPPKINFCQSNKHYQEVYHLNIFLAIHAVAPQRPLLLHPPHLALRVQQVPTSMRPKAVGDSLIPPPPPPPHTPSNTPPSPHWLYDLQDIHD